MSKYSVDLQMDDTVQEGRWTVEAPDYIRALRQAWELVEEESERIGRTYEFGTFGVTLNEV